MTSDKQSESQPVQQNNDPKPRRTLTDGEIEELISFFQLLARWEREGKIKTPSLRHDFANRRICLQGLLWRWIYGLDYDLFLIKVLMRRRTRNLISGPSAVRNTSRRGS